MIVKMRFDGAAFRPVDVEQLRTAKAQAVKDAYYAFTIEKWGEARTRSQQGLLHELLGRCARATGYNLDEIKMQFKTDLGYYVPAPAILSGDVDPPKYRGQFVDLNAVYPAIHPQHTLVFMRSEASYTKRMENEFIDYVLQYASANEVDISDIVEVMRSR